MVLSEGWGFSSPFWTKCGACLGFGVWYWGTRVGLLEAVLTGQDCKVLRYSAQSVQTAGGLSPGRKGAECSNPSFRLHPSCWPRGFGPLYFSPEWWLGESKRETSQVWGMRPLRRLGGMDQEHLIKLPCTGKALPWSHFSSHSVWEAANFTAIQVHMETCLHVSTHTAHLDKQLKHQILTDQESPSAQPFLFSTYLFTTQWWQSFKPWGCFQCWGHRTPAITKA